MSTLKPSLAREELRHICLDSEFDFETTAELRPVTRIIGQPRGTRAIEFGIGIRSEGYNIYILGPRGSGRTTAIEQFLQQRTRDQPTPADWVYVHNFEVPHQPRAIGLSPGGGTRLKADMARLIECLLEELPEAFGSDSYRDLVEEKRRSLEKKRGEALHAFQQKAAEQGFALLRTPSGFVVAPVRDGQPLSPQALQTMSVEKRQALEKREQKLSEELVDLLETVRQMEEATRQQIREADREIAAAVVHRPFADLRQAYAGQEAVLTYLEGARQDVLEQVETSATAPGENPSMDLRHYEVNLLVDNSETQGAPVVIESNPTYYNLFGRLEYEMQAGVLTTHFTNIKCGSLHWANGGYLLIDAHDLLQHSDAWEALKRALKGEEIVIQMAAVMSGSQVLAKSLAPEAIPLSVKVILMGSPEVYYLLYGRDQDFSALFKVRADFDSIMPRDREHTHEYALFVASRCHEEQLNHFDRSAVGKVVEFGSRLAGYQDKLATRFGAIADLIREASYWSTRNGRQIVTAADVQQALAERAYRASYAENRIHERILKGTLFIATEGAVVGQVNGLSVIDMGEHSFGQPGRITARTFMGDGGIIHIEGETEMSGPIHEKGVLTLVGYLGGTYAREHPLSVSASITFEQTYSGVDGDSASSTELYALLSSLSGVPLNQGIAATGSVNQRGEVQPIGGVNEKVEGFFRICAARGLTGQQGVLIPESNMENLMLQEDVVAAVADGKFHIWPVRTIDQGIELLTGIPAGTRQADGRFPEGTIHYLVQNQLRQLAIDLKRFADQESE